MATEQTVMVTYNGMDFEVTGDYSKYEPMRMYMPNGDPGYPAEGGKLENVCIILDNNEITEILSDKALDDIVELAEQELGGRIW
jgi:hypothetical protein